MKKRFLGMILVSILTISLAGGGTEGSNTAEAHNSTAPTEESTTEPTSGESTVEPASEEVTEEPASEETPTEPASVESTEEEGEYTESGDTGEMKQAINEFSRKLYNEYGKEDNLFFSPFSICSAIALSELAARGETAEGINKALSIKDFDAFKEGMKSFYNREQKESAYFRTANGLFIDKSLNLSPDYEEKFAKPAEEFFDGDFRQVDFRDTDTVKREISEWVKDATEEMIPDYQPGVDRDTVADILNAVYFYGEWQYRFSHNDTWEESFHGKDKDSDIEMMHMDDVSLCYFSDKDGLKAVALPYMDSSYEMDLIMYTDPEKKDLSAVFEDSSPSDILERLDSAEKTKLGSLVIPKFKQDLTLSGLKDALIKMGMGAAFSGEADFSYLSEDLTISDICHRAVVEVDEEGSRAAAVTELMVGLASLPIDEPKEEFIADRPFVYVIRDRESGVILFMGRFSTP